MRARSRRGLEPVFLPLLHDTHPIGRVLASQRERLRWRAPEPGLELVLVCQ